MKHTQKQLIIKYCELYGSITPAKMANKEFYHNGVYVGFFGSELSKACRVLFKGKILLKQREGKFTRFFLNSDNLTPTATEIAINTLPKQKTEDMFPEPKNWGNNY